MPTAVLVAFAVWLGAGLAVAVRRRGPVALVEAFFAEVVAALAVLTVLAWGAL